MSDFRIAGRPIGPDHSPYIVAELSANHGGSLDHALGVMTAAAKSGADAVKLQTYTPDTITIDHPGDDFRIKGGLWDGRSLYELYDEAHTPWAWHERLFRHGRDLGVTVFSSPFDSTAVALLEKLDAPAYKIASFELVDLPLIECVAKTGKPTVFSTGMATPEEIEEAISAFRAAGGRQFLLLHCISGYPTPIAESNLRRIPALAQRFNSPIGLSDHTLGVEAAVAAIAIGACFIEKHFTLRRSDGGPDSAFSLEPEELTLLVNSAKAVYSALGSGGEERAKVERESLVFRRSLYVVRDVAAGEVLTEQNVRVIRPGFGLAPKHLPKVLGRHAACDIKRGTALDWNLLARTPQH